MKKTYYLPVEGRAEDYHPMAAVEREFKDEI
jgi:hypothetical protein